MTNVFNDIDPTRVKRSIHLLKQNMNEGDIVPLLEILQQLAEDPTNGQLLIRFSEVFEGLGIMQGAALTYAPYLTIILSDDPFNNPA